MKRRKKNAGEGYGYMFHGAFSEKKDAVAKERKTKGAWIKPTWYKDGLRYVVMSPRTNPIKRKHHNPRYGKPEKDHCEMCGRKSGLKQAPDPSGIMRTLCRDCRVGSKQLLDAKQRGGGSPTVANPAELLVMGANPGAPREFTVPPGSTITIRANPANPLFTFTPGLLTGRQQRALYGRTPFNRRVAGMMRRARGRRSAAAAPDLKREVQAALESQGYRRTDAKRATAAARGNDFNSLFMDAQSRIRSNPDICGAMVGGEPCTRKPGHRGPHLPQGVRKGWHPNPSAAALRETFTGLPAEFTSIAEEPHMPAGDYAQLGELLALYVKPHAGGQVQQINFGKNRPLMLSDESARQIYFSGGNQNISASLAAFGARSRGGLFELGEARRIDYKQRKEHVRDPDVDEWRHEFGEETGVRPVVLFDPVSKRLLLEGGEYQIRAEGIVN